MFALTWFFLVSSTLISFYSAKSALMSLEISKQSELMKAEELFYRARNFEFDFLRAVNDSDLENFKAHWSLQGDFSYGHLDRLTKKCVQVNQGFKNYVESRKIIKDQLILFEGDFCVTLNLDDDGFKTSGIIVPLICLNTSSPYFLC